VDVFSSDFLSRNRPFPSIIELIAILRASREEREISHGNEDGIVYCPYRSSQWATPDPAICSRAALVRVWDVLYHKSPNHFRSHIRRGGEVNVD
jgi:hypothetical protein